MTRAKPCRGQTEIDWDRGAQLALLDAVPIASTAVTEGLGKKTYNVGKATIRSVLRAIDSHCRGDLTGWPSDARLADVTDISERQVRRAIKALEQLQYVVVRSRPGRSRLFSINWTELALQTPGWLDQSTSEPGLPTSEPSLPTSEPSVRTSELSAPTSELGSDEPLNRPRNVPPSSPNDDTSGSPLSWQAVEEVLCVMLSDWRRVLRAVRQTSVGPPHVLAIIRHYQSLGGRVGPGALYWRLKNCHPSLDPQTGWPEVSTPAAKAEVISDPSNIEMRIVREGRRRGLNDEQIRPVLQRALADAGFGSDAVEF